MQEYTNIVELLPKQKRAGRVVVIVVFTLGVVFIVLTAVLEQLPNTARLLPATILTTLVVIFLTYGIIQKNPVSTWLVVAFLVPLIIEILTINDITTYAQIYPLYISIPFFASLIIGTIWRNIKPHLLSIIFFGALAVIFTFQSSGVFYNIDSFNPWAIVLPLAAIVVITFVLYIAIKLTRKN
ncbi:MAG: hypothetical protein FWE13_05520 [Firmicutes bacterium]|nr:hypothetical protein [Bacillota bacterium]